MSTGAKSLPCNVRLFDGQAFRCIHIAAALMADPVSCGGLGFATRGAAVEWSFSGDSALSSTRGVLGVACAGQTQSKLGAKRITMQMLPDRRKLDAAGDAGNLPRNGASCVRACEWKTSLELGLPRQICRSYRDKETKSQSRAFIKILSLAEHNSACAKSASPRSALAALA